MGYNKLIQLTAKSVAPFAKNAKASPLSSAADESVISVEPKPTKFNFYRLTKHITPESGVMCR